VAGISGCPISVLALVEQCCVSAPIDRPFATATLAALLGPCAAEVEARPANTFARGERSGGEGGGGEGRNL